MDTDEKAAAKMAAEIKQLSEEIYVPRHEYRQVDSRDFRHLDLHYYDSVRDALLAQGCHGLGDIENVTLKNSKNDPRTFIRTLASRDRDIAISLYQPKPKIWLRLLLWIFRIKLGRVFDCESAFSNGVFLVTSNAAMASPMKLPRNFDSKFFPFETPFETILQSHQQRIREFLTANPGVNPILYHTLDDVLKMQHRQEAAKAAFRKSFGFVDEDELKKLGMDPQMATAVKRAADNR
ncbi:MAG TPA: hypothetical protein VF988_04980 [Verrucomicrobiae bacterium]